jgi:hypothetical protein
MTVAKSDDDDVGPVEYVNVSVPVAPLESKAVITYVPAVHEELPPTWVAYVNVPPAPTATVCSSSGLGEPPCCVTVIATLSGSDGVGVIVPLMVYAAVPEKTDPAVGLENVIEPVAAAAIKGDASSATKRGSARSWSFMVSRYGTVTVIGVVGADTAWSAVVMAEKVTVYVPAGTVVKKSWRKTVPVCPAASVSPPTTT